MLFQAFPVLFLFHVLCILTNALILVHCALRGAHKAHFGKSAGTLGDGKGRLYPYTALYLEKVMSEAGRGTCFTAQVCPACDPQAACVLNTCDYGATHL